MSLYRLTFGQCFIGLAANVHGFVNEQLNTEDAFSGCCCGASEMFVQALAPRLLNDNSAGLWRSMAGGQRVLVEQSVEHRVAMDVGARRFSKLPCMDRQETLNVPG